MVQAYEVEKSGGGVWMLLTPQEFDIIFERFLRGMEAKDLRDEEVVRVMRGLRWVDKVVREGRYKAENLSGQAG